MTVYSSDLRMEAGSDCIALGCHAGRAVLVSSDHVFMVTQALIWVSFFGTCPFNGHETDAAESQAASAIARKKISPKSRSLAAPTP